MKRTELCYIQHDITTDQIRFLNDLPEELKNILSTEVHIEDVQLVNMPLLEYSFSKSYLLTEDIAEKKKEELKNTTLSIFKKEEYKIELSGKKHIALLEEKLMRQEAQAKWDSATDRRGVISRTKRDILKAKEDLNRQITEVKNGSKITHKTILFQVYHGILG